VAKKTKISSSFSLFRQPHWLTMRLSHNSTLSLVIPTACLSPKSVMPSLIKVKGKGLDTCYSATYMSQTRDQQRFTISEVAADPAAHYEAIHCLR